MKNTQRLLVLTLPLSLLGCGGAGPASAAATPPAPPAHMNVLQMMRAFPFPHANVLFDAQTTDPVGADKKNSMVYSVYRWGDSDSYAGWEGVENSALALAEMAPILLTPRSCANGLPAPVDQPEWKAAVAMLVTAGEKAHAAAQTKDLEKMVEVSNALVDSCAACHDKFRDVDLAGGTRCTVGK